MANNKINFTFKYHVLTWSITLILSGLFLLSNLWESIKPGKNIVKLSKGALQSSKIYGILPYVMILLGGLLFIYFLYRYFNRHKWYLSVTVISLLSDFILFFNWISHSELKKVGILCLISFILWISYTVVMLLMQLYEWIINDSEKTLPKMTLVWTILAAFLGYVWGK